MFIDKPSKKLLFSIFLSATNIASFAFGITVAGGRERAPVNVVAAAGEGSPGAESPTAKPKPKPVAVKTAAPAPATPAAAPAPAVAPPAPAVTTAGLPIAGKGMWIYEFDLVGKGNVHEIVKMAKRYGLTHLYVRAGTSRSGLNTWPDVARILPVAHAAGLKVIPWFFPYLRDPAKDAARTIAVLRTSVNGHRVDGFAADIETPAEGTYLTRKRVKQYINAVRRKAPRAFMVLVPPRPNSWTIKFYPYDLVPRFDAVAPMVYWGRLDPMRATADAVSYLKRFGKPVAPIGQVYDMGPEGGPKGRPRPPAIRRFMSEARVRGSVGISFWSWQHSALPQWAAIGAFPWP
jgi:hypothetical protein